MVVSAPATSPRPFVGSVPDSWRAAQARRQRLRTHTVSQLLKGCSRPPAGDTFPRLPCYSMRVIRDSGNSAKICRGACMGCIEKPPGRTIFTSDSSMCFRWCNSNDTIFLMGWGMHRPYQPRRNRSLRLRLVSVVAASGLVATAGCNARTPSNAPLRAPAGLTITVRGRGPDVVLIHGALGDYRQWEPIGAMSESRYRVIAVSRRFHWPNPAPPVACTTALRSKARTSMSCWTRSTGPSIWSGIPTAPVWHC